MVQFGVPLIIERGDRDAEATKAAAVVRPRYASAPRYISELPDGLASELIGVCLEASRRIRLERQLAFHGPVILESAVGELTLDPISGHHWALPSMNVLVSAISLAMPNW
jgi:hypothetical protein